MVLEETGAPSRPRVTAILDRLDLAGKGGMTDESPQQVPGCWGGRMLLTSSSRLGSLDN